MIAKFNGLYAITDVRTGTNAETLVAQVDAALAGGATVIQYRDKTSAPDARRRYARALKTVCASYRAPFIVNDDVELAAEINADGVHVGADDSSIALARARLGPGAIVGASCYNDLARAAQAAAAGADYLAFGSVFPSRTKPNAVVAPHELLGQARRRFGKPVVAIGGITASNVGEIIAAGADMAAVISDVFGANDIRAAAQRIARAFNNNTT